MEKRCENCFFFVPEDGDCHRMPPVILPERDWQTPQKIQKIRWCWPDVEDNDWCGEWYDNRNENFIPHGSMMPFTQIS